MMSNITPPSEQNYYEDDESFHQVSTEMASGWGWGFGIKKIRAASWQDYCHGGTECSSGATGVDPDDTTEHIPVTGQTPYEP